MSVTLIIALLEAMAAVAPQLPELLKAVSVAVDLLMTGKEPTDEQKAVIDAALEVAHDAVQRG